MFQEKTAGLDFLRQSFSALESSLKKKLHDVQTLKFYVEKNKTLSFLEKQLQAAHISAEAIHFSENNQSEDVRLTLVASYPQFIQFLALLAQCPNSFKVADVSIQSSKIVVLFRKNLWSRTSVSPIQLLYNKHRVDVALKPLFLPPLSSPLRTDIYGVQSPFVPRKKSSANVYDGNALLHDNWRCIGTLEQEHQIRGVFLTSSGKSEYFGLNFPWRNSDWVVTAINAQEVILQHQDTHELIHLLYQKKII